MSEINNAAVPGLLDPVDGDEILSPGELVGGDTILIFSALANSADYDDIAGSSVDDVLMGLVQGLSISSNRAIRSIFQIGKVDPVLISSIGSKNLNMASIISEDEGLLYSLYKSMIMSRAELYDQGKISLSQKAVLDKYGYGEMIEGLPRDLMRIPFGLYIVFGSGDGEMIQGVHCGHCMISSDSNSVEAGTRGIPENSSIMWQKTTYYNASDDGE